jgi:hypothetical protein
MRQTKLPDSWFQHSEQKYGGMIDADREIPLHHSMKQSGYDTEAKGCGGLLSSIHYCAQEAEMS